MGNEAGPIGPRRLAVAGAALVVAAALITGGCASSSCSNSSTQACPSKHGTAVTGNAPAGTGRPAAGWTQPGADLANTRYVASAITRTNASKLGVAWTVPLTIPTAHTDGAYATTFAAVNDLALPATPVDYTGSVTSVIEAVENATGEMVAINQDTGTVEWDTLLPSSPYGAATVTNDVVFTTTFKGDLYALDAATGAILFKTPMSAGSNAPVAVDGDYVIAGAGAALSSKERDMIIAYKLGATGKLPDTVGS